MASLCLPNTNT